MRPLEEFREILAERERQDAKWGEQNHENPVWALILGEEVGEACASALDDRFAGGNGEDLKCELIQVAAVAVAWLQCIRRRAAQAPAEGRREP